MAYALFGFSTDAFEQFVRAVATIGPGVTAFGNGPDGGREATFCGKIPFPFPPTECWEGYGVIQAKVNAQQDRCVAQTAGGRAALGRGRGGDEAQRPTAGIDRSRHVKVNERAACL